MRRFVIALGAVAASAAVLFYWVALTDSGLRFAWVLAGRFVPGTLSATVIEGRLVGPIVVEGLELEFAGFTLRAQRAEIEWSAKALLRRTLEIDSLRLTDADLTAPATATGSETGAIVLPQSIRLPLTIAIRSLSIESGVLRQSQDEPVWSFTRIAFGVRLDDRLEISELRVRSNLLDMDGQIGMSSGGDYAIEAALEWAARPARVPSVTGVTRLAGNVALLNVNQTIAGPYGIDADIAVTELLADMRIAGELRLDAAPAEIMSVLPVERIDGQISVQGSRDQLALSGDLGFTMTDFVDTDAVFEAVYRGDAIDVISLSLSSLVSEARIELAGRIGVTAEPDVALAGSWTAMRWPLTGAPVLTSPAGQIELSATASELRADLAAQVGDGNVEGSIARRDGMLDADLDWTGLTWRSGDGLVRSERGTLQLRGQLDDYLLSLDAALASDPVVDGHLRASGTGNRNGLELATIDYALLDGTATGSAAVTWDAGIAAQADVRLAGVDPALVAPAWPGRIGGRVAASAVFVDGKLTVNAQDVTLAGTLRDRPLELVLQGRVVTPLDAAIDTLNLSLGETVLTAEGAIGPDLDIEWDLNSPHLDDLLPGVAGSLATSGRVHGPWVRPVFDVAATGAGIALAGDFRIGSFALMGAGDTARHSVHGTLSAEGGTAEVELTGRLETGPAIPLTWSFALERATVEHPAGGTWNLREPSAGHITPTLAGLDRSCWQNAEEASLCVGGSVASGQSQASFELVQLPLGIVNRFLPSGAVIEGNIDGIGTIELADDAPPRIDVELTTTESWIGIDDRDADTRIGFGQGSASAHGDSQRLAIEVRLPLATSTGGVELAATAMSVPDRVFADSAIAGSVRVDFPDLAFLGAVTPAIADVAGALAADLSLSGTLAAPRLLGTAALNAGSVRLPEPGIVIDNIELALNATGADGADLTGSARSGAGTLAVNGSVRLDANQLIGHITLRGESFEVIGTPTLRVLASPDLQLEMTKDRLDLSGRLLLPLARITPPELTEGVARVSPDEVIVDADQPTSVTLLRPLYANIELELGDDVRFDGLGLAGDLAGSLQITETPNEPATGSGELRIENGTYEAYRQTLTVRRGRLIFAGGPLTRPGLDVEAVRQPTEDILVGARVRGTLERPELTLFSEPGMPRQDQLSYLLFGRPSENDSSSNSSALSQAALFLGLSGSDVLTDRINRSLGFDEFGIQTEADDESTAASFVIGRFLAPSLYVSYGIGLFEQVNTLRLRYTISDRWRLETESSSESAGGDVIYRLERGE